MDAEEVAGQITEEAGRRKIGVIMKALLRVTAVEDCEEKLRHGAEKARAEKQRKLHGKNGGPCATRTHDQLVKSQLLYRLS